MGLTDQELGTILGALKLWKHRLDGSEVNWEALGGLGTIQGTLQPLSVDELNQLEEKITSFDLEAGEEHTALVIALDAMQTHTETCGTQDLDDAIEHALEVLGQAEPTDITNQVQIEDSNGEEEKA